MAGTPERSEMPRPRGGGRDRGQVALEYLGFLPVLILVAMAGVQLGLIAYTAQQAGTAARAGALSVHRAASAFWSSSSRKRSITRLCRAWSSRDSPTSLPASSVASLPTSWRSADAAALRSASIWA